MPRGPRPPRRGQPSRERLVLVDDPLSGTAAELRVIQPVDARKPYRCPGCNQEIAVGVGHVVIVPLSDPTGRRHWHQACWEHRSRRRPGR